MTTPPITALPTSPSRSMTAQDFVTAADGFIAALPAFVNEANTLAAGCDADAAATAADRVVTTSDRTAATTAAAAATAAAAQAAAVPVTPATSISPVTIASSGDKAFTLVETGKAFGVGQTVLVSSAADITRFMIGKVKSLVGQVLTVTVSGSGGSGSISSWSISLTPPTATTFSGGTTITGANAQNVVADAAADIDLSAATGGDFHTKSISSATTFTFSGVAASLAQGFLLQLTISSSAVPTWPGSVGWGGSTPPTLSNGRHQLTFVTLDGGTSWTGAVRARNIG